MSSEPTSSSSQQSPGSPPSLHLPESRRPRERSPSPLRGYLIPSPLPTRRTRTFSATVRASEGPIYKGVCKCFCRSKGHGFITPADGGPDIFVHISEFLEASVEVLNELQEAQEVAEPMEVLCGAIHGRLGDQQGSEVTENSCTKMFPRDFGFFPRGLTKALEYE
ncbi:calcium-regulated heat-stable protein 1 isoform X1 [Motacilla alba alba]|uniref:calcium-regulated heat-stable protein 1 isoform X1 n=1 Tax=Motacilla alba alba TaxID=1094192 RepID=UPI0018D57E2A|nr:calcium-regulated heat-stable protein 1 isoform X1 [Motacilla alba alba]